MSKVQRCPYISGKEKVVELQLWEGWAQASTERAPPPFPSHSPPTGNASCSQSWKGRTKEEGWEGSPNHFDEHQSQSTRGSPAQQPSRCLSTEGQAALLFTCFPFRLCAPLSATGLLSHRLLEPGLSCQISSTTSHGNSVMLSKASGVMGPRAACC